MKKLTVFLIILILIAIAVFVGINLSPKDVHISAQGFKYKLGNGNTESGKIVNVNVEGKLHKSLTGKRTFKGTLNIEGEDIPVPADQRQLNMPISQDGWGVISYPYFEYKRASDGSPEAVNNTHIYQYGSLFINSDFSKVTILVSDQKESDGSGASSWSAEDGQMITAPASSRSEAIRLSNELMKDFLKGFELR